MLLKISLVLLIISTCFAHELEVFSQHREFKLSFTPTSLSLLSPRVKLSINRTNCNRKMVLNFYKDLNKSLQFKNLSKLKKPSAFKLILSGNTYYLEHKSKLASQILSLPEQFYRLKFEEQSLCN